MKKKRKKEFVGKYKYIYDYIHTYNMYACIEHMGYLVYIYSRGLFESEKDNVI